MKFAWLVCIDVLLNSLLESNSTFMRLYLAVLACVAVIDI